MAKAKVPSPRDAGQVAALLRLPEIMRLIADLDETRWTGRPGNPVRVMVAVALVKAMYALPDVDPHRAPHCRSRRAP